ncbi:hypothetical protein NC652_029653 [Populus alba x Populus x berolinensis]|nr:hypothetical protein NC652_029653 [Populus alba x Populus x berolinensis]
MFSEKKTNLLMINCLIKLQGLGAFFKFIPSLPSANLPTACIQLFRESMRESPPCPLKRNEKELFQ